MMITDCSEPSKLYTNRELSWLQFEKRVLNEAADPDNKLFERLKFLSITGTNLDEFFMIRVATLKSMENTGYEEPDIAGMTAKEQLCEVARETHELVKEQYRVFNESILDGLADNGIDFFKSYKEMKKEDRLLADAFYCENVFPALTPIVIDETRAFPLLRNRFLYVGACVEKTKTKKPTIALVQIPTGINRVVSFRHGERVSCIPVEEIVKEHFRNLFGDNEISGLCTFRIIRNADLSFEENEPTDFLAEVERKIEQRELQDAIRLEITGKDTSVMENILVHELRLSKDDVYVTDGPVDFSFLLDIYKLDGFERLKNTEYVPVMPWEFDRESSLFEQIKEHDLMLIHPFESFEPVIDFINEAARDENVLAIKQTLYRVSGNSPIVNALTSAAENGKQVTVLVELKARFDEENNINWARVLENAGCNVIYGFAHLKTHCKITLVVRKEQDKIVRYVHLGTGNYNDSTARLYTDIGFFTANEDFGEDAGNLFNMLSGFTKPGKWNKLSLAPDFLRNRFIELIDREASFAKNGVPSHIIAKMNSICDKQIIDAIYRAGACGVKIDLIVRGICSLKVGIPGVSENITVRSIVGNFLEHSRIFYFKNGGNPEYYCSSADWMPRNMDKRIELLFPVERPRLREKLNHVLRLMLKDNLKAWILEPDGSYRRKPDDEELYAFQDGFCKEEAERLKDN